MSDNDFIRRGDAAKAMADYHWKRYASRAEGGTLSSPAVFTSHTWQDVQDIIRAIPAADARAEALLKRAAQMAYEVWDDPEALSKAILALIPEAKP